ncbi:MAG TPA: hypothetical protein VGH40_14145 [Roseiarcus sp.]|jgi:hypothetical protein
MRIQTMSAIVLSAVLMVSGPVYVGTGSTHTHDDPKKCRSLVTLKNLPTKAAKKAEYDKCMAAGPENYQ